jgi:hypothetical protein
MKPKKHPLQILEDNLAYFQLRVSTQSDPSNFNALATAIQLRIDIILKYIRTLSEHVTKQELDFAFKLLRIYITLWEQYFSNHPWRSQQNQQ